jgi:hypothetical protein
MGLREKYEQMDVDRSPFLDRARDCSRLTIPTLFPPNGHGRATRYPTPWQSMGARAVNNLAAKLLLALFPPNAPCFKLQIDDFTLQKLTQRNDMRGAIDEALNKVERAVQMELETSQSRPSLFEALKQLIVGGNSLIRVSPDNRLRVFKLDQFVCKRDPMGHPLLMVTKECLSLLEVPDDVRPFVKSAKNDGKTRRTDDTVDLFTGFELRRTNGEATWHVWQEIDGSIIPNSQGTYPHDRCPARPLRWTALDGEDYGRGMVEEYLGDLKSLEGLQKAIVQGSAAAAKVLFLVRPNSTTSIKVLAESESGDVRSGHKDDVTVLQMEKYADFKIALDTRNDLIQSLSFAFMLNTAIQRQGERVTAEEIRYMAQELESGLGGVYSTMSQDLQLPLVDIVMSNLQRSGHLPTMPKGVVKPTITTGIEAIGRGNDLNRLKSFVTDASAALTPEVMNQYLILGEFIKRMGTSYQIDMSGLIKDEQQVQQERQQQMIAEAAQRAAPNIANQVGNAVQAQQGATPNG